MVGIIPYIALQLKPSPEVYQCLQPKRPTAAVFLKGNTIYIAAALAFLLFLFGTRSIDASEKHEGLVAAIAFESVIKLVAF